MALVNRDKDASEQKDMLYWSSQLANGTAGGGTFGNGYVPTGATLYLWGPMPYPYTLQSLNAIAPTGGSGAIELTPLICRAMSGGFTVIAVSISNMVVVQGPSFNSGATVQFGYSGLAPAGSTLLLGQRGDVIAVLSAKANTAANCLLVQAVVKKTQDIVSLNGSSV